jgi:hypothetical protein
MHSAALGKNSGNPGGQMETTNGEVDLTVLNYTAFQNKFRNTAGWYKWL